MNLKKGDRIELTSSHPLYGVYLIKRGYIISIGGDKALVRMDWKDEIVEIRKDQYRIRR